MVRACTLPIWLSLIIAASISSSPVFSSSSVLANESSPGSPISFELDIQPILTANGCNAGACHGKQRGQNGFQLSLLAFDSDFDFAAPEFLRLVEIKLAEVAYSYTIE